MPYRKSYGTYPYARVIAPIAYRYGKRAYTSYSKSKASRTRPYMRGSRRSRAVTLPSGVKRSRMTRLRGTRKPTVRNNKKQIKRIKDRLDTSQTEYKVRTRTFFNFASAVNQSSHNEIDVYNNFKIQAELSDVPYVDPAAPSVVGSIDLNTAAYHRKILIRSVYSHIEVTNPTNAPVHLKVYCVRPKKDTNNGPVLAFQEGINDIMSFPQTLSTQVFLNDSELFKDLYHIVKHKTKKLMPGKTMTYSHSVKDIKYDTSIATDEDDRYQTDLKPFLWLFRQEGISVNEDNADDQQGTLNTKINVREDKVLTMEYDGGAVGLKRIKLNDDSTSLIAPMFTNNPCTCQVTFKQNAQDRRVVAAEATTLAVNSLNTQLGASFMALTDAILDSEDHLSDIASDVSEIASDVEEIADDL